MKKIAFIILIIIANTALAQYKDSVLVRKNASKIAQQHKELQELKQKIKSLQTKWQQVIRHQADNQRKSIDSLQHNIAVHSEELGMKMRQTTEHTNTQLSDLNSSVAKNRLYWIIGLLIMLLLGGVAYLFLRKRIKSSKNDLEMQIRNTRKSLEEEGIKLDQTLVEILEKQLTLQQEKNKMPSAVADNKEDHSLALKVADEIVRMQKNIARMDENTKGLKPLSKGIERIQANFAANGYEILNLLNREYEDRMNVDVINFVNDEQIAAGKKIITKIIKPQVNYNGVLIQRAQVEVSQN